MTRLNLVREGNGPIVVLSHALGCDLRMWDGVAAQLARAASPASAPSSPSHPRTTQGDTA